jgi:tryptophan-rich sensory protein
MDLERLAFAVVPVVGAAVLGGLASRDAPQTYQRLQKPGWAPPASAFGPVWTGLYAGTAVAGWLLYPHASRGTRALHLTQLALNAAWPAAFFGVRDKRAALAVIAALDSTLTAEIVRLRDEDPRAAALLTPYLAWTGFATALNAAVSEPTKA